MGLQITFIFIIDCFLNYLINWFVYKISEKKVGKFPFSFPRTLTDVYKFAYYVRTTV